MGMRKFTNEIQKFSLCPIWVAETARRCGDIQAGAPHTEANTPPQRKECAFKTIWKETEKMMQHGNDTWGQNEWEIKMWT